MGPFGPPERLDYAYFFIDATIPQLVAGRLKSLPTLPGRRFGNRNELFYFGKTSKVYFACGELNLFQRANVCVMSFLETVG